MTVKDFIGERINPLMEVIIEKEKKRKAEKLFKFLDALTESPGFRALGEELGIYEDKPQSNHGDNKDGWIEVMKLFYAFGGEL